MCRKIKNNQGSISLEACVVVPIFMFLMLFVYSFFIVFSAQSTITHTLLQCCQSVSLDPYKTENLGIADGELPSSIGDLIAELLEGDNPHFVSDSKWYKTDDETSFSDAVVNIVTGGFLSEEKEVVVAGLASTELDQIVKQRFIGYLSGGDQSKAESGMEALNIVNGLDGIVFKAVV